jgi:hypothetical protein
MCTTCAYCYSCHYKIERMEKVIEMKRRLLTLNRANPIKSPKTVKGNPSMRLTS